MANFGAAVAFAACFDQQSVVSGVGDLRWIERDFDNDHARALLVGHWIGQDLQLSGIEQIGAWIIRIGIEILYLRRWRECYRRARVVGQMRGNACVISSRLI